MALFFYPILLPCMWTIDMFYIQCPRLIISILKIEVLFKVIWVSSFSYKYNVEYMLYDVQVDQNCTGLEVKRTSPWTCPLPALNLGFLICKIIRSQNLSGNSDLRSNLAQGYTQISSVSLIPGHPVIGSSISHSLLSGTYSFETLEQKTFFVCHLLEQRILIGILIPDLSPELRSGSHEMRVKTK